MIRIPGLDASLVVDERGVSYWQVNKNWNPPIRLKREGKRKQDKGITGQREAEQARQGSVWEVVAARRVESGLQERTTGGDE